MISNVNEKNSLIDEIRRNEAGFLDVINQRLGITVRHQISEMYKTIIEACQKFKCKPADYLCQIQTCSEESPMLEHLILGVTIGETYFFRDNHQINLLRNKILPDLIGKKRRENNLSLRIWSAGCSSGEEIYTIAMLLDNLLPDFDQWTLKLIGTDINTKSLQKALAGKYTEWSMRSIPEEYKKRYFSWYKNEYVLANEIRNAAEFYYLNLNNDNYPSIFNNTNAQDLILCRNVLIYFNDKSVANIMKRLHACLVPEGYLMLGASDPVYLDNVIFKLLPGAFLKPGEETIAIPQKPAIQPIKEPVKKTVMLPRKKPVVMTAKRQTGITSLRQQLQMLQQEYKWYEMLELIHHFELMAGKTPDLLNIKATACANLGQLDSAMQFCKESLGYDPTNKHTWLTYSLILAELNQLSESEAALRKVLYLDHHFVPGHFQLGLLLLRIKSFQHGLKCLHNALFITQHEDQLKTVPGSPGLSYGALAEILKHEIELYERKLT